MSLDGVPSKAEVMGWNPQYLADYMKTLKLSGCSKVVTRGSITGTQFMQMTERDLQVFPSRYIPIITKIQSDIINKKEQKKAFGHKSKANNYPKQDLVQEEEIWSSDEFENDSDYEGQYQEEEDENYICAVNEPETDEQQEGEETDEEEYEVPPFADTMQPPQQLKVAKPKGHHGRDPGHNIWSPEKTSKRPHPPPPGRDPGLPPRPVNLPAVPQSQKKKPEQPGPSQKDSMKSKGGTFKASSSFRISFQRSQKNTDESNRVSKPTPPPSPQTPPDMVAKSKPGARAVANNSGLDPSWYGGKMTRHQAEAALRQMNEDGAFVVRDSSKGSAEHQYTLMVLKAGKVYNIQIRNQGNSFCLGTGLKKTKSFPGVTEMITHHAHTPLLLIDATDQSCEAQSQCCLLHPMGS